MKINDNTIVTVVSSMHPARSLKVTYEQLKDECFVDNIPLLYKIKEALEKNKKATVYYKNKGNIESFTTFTI